MAETLLIKRKTKRLDRPPRDCKPKGLISLPNALQKKLKCQKNLRLYFADDSTVERVPEVEGFDKFRPLADELESDDEDLLKNGNRLSDKFSTLKLKNRAENEGEYEKFHLLADKLFNFGEDLLKNSHHLIATPLKVTKDSEPAAEEDIIWKDTSCISLNADEDESEEFFKACHRSAKKIALKILQDAQSMGDLLTISENEHEANPLQKTICIDLKDDVPNPLRETQVEAEIVPKPLEDYLEKISIDSKQPEKETEKNEMSFTPEKKVPENLQVVPMPKQNKKEMPNVVPNPPEKPIDPPEKANIVNQPTKDEVQNNETSPQKEEREKPKIWTQGIKDFRFSSVEKKRVWKYNSNMFNPAGKLNTSWMTIEQPMRNKRNIIVDGSNVAYGHGRKWFSSQGLEYCLQYFEKMGHDVRAVVPMFRRNAFQSTDPMILDKLHRNGSIVFTPCKNFHGQKFASYDDRFILQLAYEWNAAVVSNDNYRDLIDESPAFRWIVETRVLSYTWCDDIFILAKDPYGRYGPTLDQILHYN